MGNQGQRAGALDQGSGSGDGGKAGSDMNITLEVKSTGPGAVERQEGLLLGAASLSPGRHQPLAAPEGLGAQHCEQSRGPASTLCDLGQLSASASIS